MWLSVKSNVTKFLNEWKPRVDDNFETPEEYRLRWRSIRTIYFALFLTALGFSSALGGAWPYLSKVSLFKKRKIILM